MPRPLTENSPAWRIEWHLHYKPMVRAVTLCKIGRHRYAKFTSPIYNESTIACRDCLRRNPHG